MNREIKFRGKRLDNGEWVFGDLLTKYPHHKGLTIVENGVIHHEVDPETVGQYTGLDDEHAREIYDGDIVCCKELRGQRLEEYTSVVFWDEYSFLVSDAYGHWSGLGLFSDDPTKRPLTEIEVIGNKWDNPQLVGAALECSKSKAP